MYVHIYLFFKGEGHRHRRISDIKPQYGCAHTFVRTALNVVQNATCFYPSHFYFPLRPCELCVCLREAELSHCEHRLSLNCSRSKPSPVPLPSSRRNRSSIATTWRQSGDPSSHGAATRSLPLARSGKSAQLSPSAAVDFYLELVGNPWQCDLHSMTIKSLCQESLQLEQGWRTGDEGSEHRCD